MQRLSLALLLALLFSHLALATLTQEQQASLDGAYAAINQKTILGLQRGVAAGKMTAAQVAPDILNYTNAVKGMRARWANTPYKQIFEAAYQKEMNRQPAPPPAGNGAGSGTVPGQATGTTSPLGVNLQIPDGLKLVLFIFAIWLARKLWKAPAQGVSNVNMNQYGPVELGAQDLQQMEAVKQTFEGQTAEIERKAAGFARQMQSEQATLAALAARASARASAILSSSVAALNQAAPEFETYRANLEKRYPATTAPWSSDIWQDFEKNPKPETPFEVCVAHVQESALPGEQPLLFPHSVPLIKAKGPIIVRCDTASREAARNVIHNILLRAALAAPAEVCFSLIDPFGMGGGFPMRKLLPRVRPSTFAAADELAAIMEDIRRVNDAVGQAESFASLSREQRAGELFEIIAVLDYPGEYQRDPRALDYLARIAQSGPRAGRHLILEWNGAPTAAELARFQNAEIIDVAGASEAWHFDPVASPEQRQNLLNATGKLKSESTGGDWDALVRPSRFFAETSERMVGTTVGERLSIWFGENQDRKPCMHGMMAGQSGSGKSSLLHVLITGLAARYSPDELQLVLVDGKAGVEFEKYRRLPHAQVVCLKTPAAVARSVLADFEGEMNDRWDKFGLAEVQKLEDYRRVTGQKMPRMLMVVDEFQQLLAGDPDRGAELLTNVLEKGRAAGIHLLLASQTFEVRGLPAAAMAHVHLRAALMLAGDYVQGLTAFNVEGKKLIRSLSQGQVVINDESGRDGANSRGAVARLDNESGSSLSQIIASITDAAGGPGSAVVLTGQDAAVLADNPFVQQWKSTPPDAATLQTVAQKKVRDGGFGITEWSMAERPLPLWLGRKFDVRGHVAAVLRRGQGQNLLALGSRSSIRMCMLANALAGLRSMHSMNDCEILFLDGLGETQAGAGMLSAGLDVLRDGGARVTRAAPETASSALEAFASSVAQPRSPDAVRLLIVAEPDYLPDLAAPQGYGTAPTGGAKIFKDLLRSGPNTGVHCIVTASGLRALSSVVAVRELTLFNHRAVQQTNDDESFDLFGKKTASQIKVLTDHPMGAMYVDWGKGVSEAQLFKSYGAVATMKGDPSAADLAAALQATYGAGA
jgi:DNA segregation ATPase FtsK/SpoIIIE, S-DNA-T family